ncbi:MAG: hypothetical protein Q4C46_00895 [Bacillota bacterium]|nr:hypothetical protein [Bacillota bacterium]
MEVLQGIYIFILNPIGCALIKIPEKVKDVFIGICFAALFAIQVFRYSRVLIWEGGNIDHTEQSVMGCVLLLLILILSIKVPLRKMKVNRILSYLWLLCAAIMIAVSFIHPVGNGIRAMALSMIVAFPCFWFIWCNRGDLEKVFELASKGIAWFGCAYLMYCLLFIDYNDAQLNGRYIGSTLNPNNLGFICAAVLVASLYLIIYNKKYSIIYSVTGGLACMVTMMTVSRTTMLCDIVIIGVFIVFYIKTKIICNNDKKKDVIKLIVTITILCAFSFAVVIINSNSIDSTEVSSIKTMNSYMLTAANEQTQESVSDSGDKLALDRLSKKQTSDIDSMSSGRTIIWQEYLKSMNLIGHDGNKLLYIEGYGSRQWAHNTALEIGYRTGVVNGIIFFVIEIIAGLYALKFTFSRKCMKPYHLFSAMSIVGFCIYSVLEVVIFPFFAPPVFLFFIGIGPLFFKTDSRREQHQHAS